MRKIVGIIAVLFVLILSAGVIFQTVKKSTFYVTVDDEKVIKDSSFNLTSLSPLTVKVFADKVNTGYEVSILRNDDLDFRFEQNGIGKRYSELETDFTKFFIIEKFKGGFLLSAMSYNLCDILAFSSANSVIQVDPESILHKPLFVVKIQAKGSDYTVTFGLYIGDVSNITLDEIRIVI